MHTECRLIKLLHNHLCAELLDLKQRKYKYIKKKFIYGAPRYQHVGAEQKEKQNLVPEYACQTEGTSPNTELLPSGYPHCKSFSQDHRSY